jgi:hypothetical protein
MLNNSEFKISLKFNPKIVLWDFKKIIIVFNSLKIKIAFVQMDWDGAPVDHKMKVEHG